MTQDRINRRDILRWTAGTSAGFLLGGQALAQKADLLDALGDRIFDQLNTIKLPGKPLNLVRVVSSIVRMEQQANERRLPFSPLAFNAGPALAPVEATLYQSAVPRLVALVDRSEGTDPGLADEAGELLAEVHAAEHETPEALKTEAPAIPVLAPATSAATINLPMSRAMKYPLLKDEYARLFASVAIRDEFRDNVAWHVRLINAARPRYDAVGKNLGVPWYFIGAIHGLEASFNFRAHLHNGDFPLKTRTRQVPAGRPLVWLPPDDWESSAKDAIRLLGFANQSDWSLERTLYRLEAYNGFGYRKRGVPTPYLWAYSAHYERGKFIADGRWSDKAKSQQCGAAVLIKALADSGAIQL